MAPAQGPHGTSPGSRPCCGEKGAAEDGSMKREGHRGTEAESAVVVSDKMDKTRGRRGGAPGQPPDLQEVHAAARRSTRPTTRRTSAASATRCRSWSRRPLSQEQALAGAGRSSSARVARGRRQEGRPSHDPDGDHPQCRRQLRAPRRWPASRCWAASRRRYATVGDIIVVSVKEAIPNAKVKKGDVSKAVVVRTRKEVGRTDGSYIRFDDNSAVLINNAGRAHRHAHLRAVARELRAQASS